MAYLILVNAGGFMIHGLAQDEANADALVDEACDLYGKGKVFRVTVAAIEQPYEAAEVSG